MGLTEFKSRAVFLLNSLGENLFSCFVQFLMAAHLPWLVASSSVFKDSNGQSSSSI